MAGQQLEKVVLRRIHLIDAEIRKGIYPNTRYLAELLEVGERTISRDIDEMRNFYNAPIEYDRRHNGYYYTEDSFFIEDLSLSQSELLSMALFDKLLGEYRSTPLEAQLKSVFHKIVSSLGNQTMADFFQLQEGVSCVPRLSDPVDAKVFSDVFLALRNHQELSMHYQGDKRIIRPLHVVCDKGNWHVLAQTTSREIQLFALSKMENTKVLRRTFSFPRGFDWHNYFDQSDIRWQNDDVIPEAGMAGGSIEYIKGDELLINSILDQWLYIFWDKSAIRHAKYFSEFGELQLRGDDYSFQFREGTDEDQRYLSKEMIIPAPGIAGNQRISFCYLNSVEEGASRITLLFNRLHNVGRTLLYVCVEDCKGKETKALASVQDDITLEKFLTLLGRSDVYKEYDTFVMLMKDAVPLLTYKEQRARERAEKEILAKLQPILDELVASGKLDALGTGYGPDITALNRIVDKGIARATKRRG